MDDFEKIFDQGMVDDATPAPAEPEPSPQIEESQPTPAVEQPPVVADAPTPEVPAEPIREDNGRFAPVSALQEERQKRQELERRLAEIERAQPAPKPAEQPRAPDPYDDPQGFAAYQRQQTEQSMFQMRLQMSHEMAKTQFGPDVVEQARLWAVDKAAQDPAFNLAFGQQAHPLAWVVQQHKRDALLQQIGEDPDAFVRRRYAELTASQPAPIAAVPAAVPAATPQPVPVPAAPPRSLVSTPAAGGAAIKDIPIGGMSALDAAFK